MPFYVRALCFHRFWYICCPQILRDDCICFYLRTSKVVEFHLKTIISFFKKSVYCGIREAWSKNIYTERLPFCMCMYICMCIYSHMCMHVDIYICACMCIFEHGYSWIMKIFLVVKLKACIKIRMFRFSIIPSGCVTFTSQEKEFFLHGD